MFAVTILHAIGLILDIPSTVLGITILAIGNASSKSPLVVLRASLQFVKSSTLRLAPACSGDMAADVSVAKEGIPQMAIAACHAAPSFNILFGLGLSNLVGIAQHGSETLQPGRGSNTLVYVAFGFLLFGLASCFILVPLQGFVMKRPFGFYMLGLYVVFFVTVVVLSTA
jgi:sodium/potassium/calcium exchanger 6